MGRVRGWQLFAGRMERARRFLVLQETMERQLCLPATADLGDAEYLTAAAALVRSGLTVEKWATVAEGLAMLEVLEGRLWEEGN